MKGGMRYHKAKDDKLTTDTLCACGKTMPTAYFHLVKRIWQCELCMLIDDANENDDRPQN